MQNAKLSMAGLLAIGAFTAQAATTTVTDLSIDRGGTVRIAYTRPDAPRANLILLTGGNGLTNLQPDGNGASPEFFFNPPYRTRPLFVDRGYSLVIVDAPSDQFPSGMSYNYRASTTHLSELRAVLGYVRQRDDIPTWVWGYSAGAVSAVNMGLNLSSDSSFGLVLLSPTTFDASGAYPPSPTVLDMNLEALRRPTLVVKNADDPCPSDPPAGAATLVSRITAAPARGHIVFTGGSPGTRATQCDSTGYHGLGGQDAEFVAAVVGWTTTYAYLAHTPNYTSLWWNPSESGWGINVNHQGDIAFATLFIYDASGNPVWLVMSKGVRQGSADTFSGPLYQTTGPAFNANPFTPIGPANLTQVGDMVLSFSGRDAGTLTYSVNGTTVTKPITKQVYGSRGANCLALAESRNSLTNYQDLWWNPSESGWGVNVTHQDNTLFATLFTYDARGKALWLLMSGGTKQTDGSYLGDLYQTTGSAFNAQPFIPITSANITKVGTMRFTFADGVTGTLEYALNGASVLKAITRQAFAIQVPSCS